MKKTILIAILFCILSTPCWANVALPLFVLMPTIIQSSVLGIALGDFFRNASGLSAIALSSIFYEIILLWVVVQVEYLYLRKALSDLNKKILKKQIWKANMFSTFIGFLFWVPLAFQPYRIAGYIFAGPIALLPLLGGRGWNASHFFFFILLIVFTYFCFKLSHWTEAPFLRKIRSNYSEEQINKAVKIANRRSYLFLTFFILMSIFALAVIFS